MGHVANVFAIVDVTDWPLAEEEPLGTKPKQWLRHPDSGERRLWKESTWNVAKDGSRYRKGDDWSERVACKLARRLGVPAADIELAERDGTCGTVSRSFAPKPMQLVHGNELLAELTTVSSDPRDPTGYTLDAVKRVLATVEPPTEHAVLTTAFDWFAGFLVLDALVGNTDRHKENWGALEVRGTRHLAPSFDHASSLGFLLSDAERSERLTTRDHLRAIDAWAARARTPFQGRSHPCHAAARALQQVDTPVGEHWYETIEALPSIAELLDRVPRDRISESAAEFANRLYEVNRANLSHAIRKVLA
jgi:hypothetical protein